MPPLPLVEVDANDHFIVNENALEMLREIKGKICIIAMAGLYRTGKSSYVKKKI